MGKEASEAAKDYTGQGTGVEMIDTIDNEEQLQEYLKGQKQSVETGNRNPDTGLETEEEEEIDEVTGEPKKKPTAPAKQPRDKKKPVITDPNHPDYKLPESLEDEPEEEEEDEEYSNVVQYLNSEYDLGLNLKALPENMTREQEAEAVGTIFKRLNDGVQAKLAEYQHIDELLEDPETAAFLEAKKAGKTLKDIAAAYIGSSEGAPDDVIVARHIKVMYPTLTDAEIQEEIKTLRDGKKLDKRASAARDYFKAQDAATATQAEQARLQQIEQEKIEYQQSVNQFAGFLNKTSKLYDIPITPQMKKAVFEAVTKRDKDGLTLHDKALQSDAGTFLSVLGMFYMKNLIQNGTTLKANKKNRDFKESLFDSTEKLQRSSEAQQEPDFNAELANQF